jgi:uncharacterized protein YjbI with pentapeptide repeats
MHVGLLTQPPFERILTAREKRELHHALFRDRVLVGLDLSGADLHGACFERTIMSSCSLAGADLGGARFVLCDLRCVDMSSVDLNGSDFRGTMLTDIAGLSADDRSLVQRAGGTFQQARASLR